MTGGRGARRLAALATLLVVSVGCGGGDDASVTAGPARDGRELFRERVLAGNPGCITCHSLDEDTVLVGPAMAGIGTRAETREPELSAEDYVRASIVTPDRFVVPGFDPGEMPPDWGEVLTPGEIDALVAYLMTLR